METRLCYSLLIIISVTACDTLHRDDPIEESMIIDPVEYETNQHLKFLYPGNEVVFNLIDNSDGNNTEFEVYDYPINGLISFSEPGIIKYEPNIGFDSGSDFFSIATLSNNAVSRIDSIQLQMIVSDSTGLPCFNGGLPEEYMIGIGEGIRFNPILNDGFCPSEIESFTLSLRDQPEFGWAAVVSSHEILYESDEFFSGNVKFSYEFNQIQKGGQIHNAIGIVTINIGEVPCNDLIANDDTYQLSMDSLQSRANGLSGIILNPLMNDIICDEEFELSVIESEIGKAEFNDGYLLIVDLDGLEVTNPIEFTYRICAHDRCDEGDVLLSID